MVQTWRIHYEFDEYGTPYHVKGCRCPDCRELAEEESKPLPLDDQIEEDY